MKIRIIGGGPAGLYLAVLMKKNNPDHDIQIYERNRPDDTFGFGVVFSDETLGQFLEYDERSYRAITQQFAYWDEIDVHVGDQMVRSGGHGFCGMSRKDLLLLLQTRARELGVGLNFEVEIKDPAQLGDADLIVAADGINSRIREQHREHFRPRIDERPNKFVWLGTTRPLDTFTFIFRQTEHGLFQVHAYRYNDELTTWIVETTDETWRRAGLDKASEADTVAFCEQLFADDLDGHRLISNRSIWRNFPTIKCERWVHDNIVIMGDAAHTAHFSIGSGTKMAMEDAIHLFEAFRGHPNDVGAALAAYEEGRQEEVSILQHAAQVSLEWFEHTPRYLGMNALQLTFSLLSRSKRITYDNLRLRDQGFVDTVDRWFADQVREQFGFDVDAGRPVPPMFQPFRLRRMELANRVVVSPMCQYSARDGFPNDWHFQHLTSRAIGGAGLVFTEMTDVSEEGRITPGCTGMYLDEHVPAWRRITDFVHTHTRARICMQLAHAGPKASTCLPWQGKGMDYPLPEGNWPIMAASAIPYREESQRPKAMDRDDMDKVIRDFAAAAQRAEQAGFDMIEIHMAHGYLLSSFITPLMNRRDDEYGGSIENRMRFPLEVFDAVRAVWPQDKPISVRISATDWMENLAVTGDDAVTVASMLREHGVDIVDVSAGQTSVKARPVYGRMFQTPFADQVRHEAGIATIAVGNISSADQINTIVAAGRADLVALARPHLADPYFTLHAAAHYGVKDQHWPPQYAAGKFQAEVLAQRNNEDLAELRAAARPEKPQEALARLDAERLRDTG
ncbi:MAG: bifunctional salicylyl-CoA 5-hydroxylase/oxidoreductase [Aquisalimonadaceae bacterium]